MSLKLYINKIFDLKHRLCPVSYGRNSRADHRHWPERVIIGAFFYLSFLMAFDSMPSQYLYSHSPLFVSHCQKLLILPIIYHRLFGVFLAKHSFFLSTLSKNLGANGLCVTFSGALYQLHALKREMSKLDRSIFTHTMEKMQDFVQSAGF